MALEEFLTGAFQQGTRELIGLAERNRQKKGREERLKAGTEFFAAMQQYQIKGTPISPMQASRWAQFGYNVPAEALRGFDPSTLEGAGAQAPQMGAGPMAGGAVDHAAMGHVVPGATGMAMPGVAPTGPVPGSPAAAAFKAGAISGPEAILKRQTEQAQAAQDKNRQFALDQYHAAQRQVGKKPTSQLSTPEFILLSKRLDAVDPDAAIAFAKEWRRTFTDAGGKPIRFDQDLINSVDVAIDGGAQKREDFTSEQWRYMQSVTTPKELDAWVKNKFSSKDIRDFGLSSRQVKRQSLWPFGGELGDLEKWATGNGSQLSKEKRDYFAQYYFTTGEENHQATFEEGLKVSAANQAVMEAANVPEETQFIMGRVLQERPEDIDWGVVAEDLPLSMTLDEFKERYVKAYKKANNGRTPQIP